MLPIYTLSVEIIAKDATIDRETFLALSTPSLTHLEELMGSFVRTPNKPTYYPPGVQGGSSVTEYWSARGFVQVSLGRDRAKYLVQLYEAVAHLIELELPDCEVRWRVERLQFS